MDLTAFSSAFFMGFQFVGVSATLGLGLYYSTKLLGGMF